MITGVKSIRMDDSPITNLKKLLIVKRILLVSTIRDLERKVLRTWILMLRYKGLICLRGRKVITKLALGTIFKTIKIVETGK